jgi:hypothetical protein
MRPILLTILLALFAAGYYAAQPPTPATQAPSLRNARVNIWTGSW